MAPRLQFLLPYTSHAAATVAPARCSAYVAFYELARAQAHQARRGGREYGTGGVPEQELTAAQSSAFRTRRINTLKEAQALEYPRFSFKGKPTSTRQFRTEFERATSAEMDPKKLYCIHGRVIHIRQHGPRFSFVRFINDGVPLQIMVNHKKLHDNTSDEAFKEFHTLLQRGDHISVTGVPAISSTGTLCIEARELPKLFSPCLVPLPMKNSPETAVQNRHTDLLINRSSRETLILRSFIIRHIRAHLSKVLKCVEVQTPILAANAGGALARPFATRSSEFPRKELALRIAPELWLKRLVVAGMDRVYELGPSFRNEGIDATHNPEFTTCEFYIAHTNLGALLNITQTLFYGIAKSVAQHHSSLYPTLSIPSGDIFDKAFSTVEFIPAIEEALGHRLPDLESETALPELIHLLDEAGKDWHRSLPPNPSLPKLLDHIAAAVIEPQSKGRPLFILYHPVCMSPLSKSFRCPHTQQHVAARGELFYDGNELANMYEEENDPFKQRAKFVAQVKERLALQQRGGGGEAAPDDALAHGVDEQYLAVLESGLPPTGGWGCGVDRLVMLFAGAKRISEVLPFGNLRHVVGLASVGAQVPQPQDGAEDGAARARVMGRRRAAAREGGGNRRRVTRPQAAFLKVDEDKKQTADDGVVNEIMYRINKGQNVIEDAGSEKKE